MVDSVYFDENYQIWVKVYKPQKVTKSLIKKLSLSSRHLGKHNKFGQRK